MIALHLPDLLPVLLPVAGALLALVADAVAPRARGVPLACGIVALILAVLAAVRPRLVATACTGLDGGTACLLDAHRGALVVRAAIVAAGLVALLLMVPQLRRGERHPGVSVALLLAATAGGAGVATAHDVGSWLVFLELASLPAIALVALTDTRAGRGAALSFLTTSLFSFALGVVGVALWVSATGSPVWGAGAADGRHRPAQTLAVLLVVAAVGFKISAVPFHLWTPQAYGGAAPATGALIAGVGKLAAGAALYAVLQPLTAVPRPVSVGIGVLAAVSAVVGPVIALRQDDVLRLLAWSAIGQSGWVLAPAVAGTPDALDASAAYLAAYVLATLVVFAGVVVLAEDAGLEEARRLSGWQGLLRARPALGACVAFALLSLAGLPPAFLGLVAKLGVFGALITSGRWGTVPFLALGVVLGIAVYARWLAMFFGESPQRHTGVRRRAVSAPVVALGAASVVLVLLSVAPAALLDAPARDQPGAAAHVGAQPRWLDRWP